MTTDMFIMGVFYAIGIGSVGILIAAAVYACYEEWKNNDNKK